ncbi:CD3337/EF1877 family mobilome membrane protein [Paenibacillus rubinfantis]|uniref:CD3337/EF1877 family mobilome membrane protein n=1 Tax=Paenibacillus rubinfantis TaxID=1720296 RepID=UPI00073EB754|nr:hypothetical protein [Paenibacillus rubinfantis]
MIRKTNNRSRRVKIVLLGLICCLLLGVILPTTIYAATQDEKESSIDRMVPDVGSSEALYNKYGASHYAFQTVLPERSFWQVGAKASDGIVRVYDHMLSAVFYVLVQGTRLFTYLTHQAFTFSFMDQLIEATEEIIQSISGVKNGSLGNGLWGSLFGTFAMITILYILFNMLRGRYMDGYQSAVGFVMALVICLGFFANAGSVIKFFNGVGNEIGGLMYSGLAKATGLNTNPNVGVKVISEQVWNELVVRPYAMLQFDDPNVRTKDEKTLREVLATDPFSPEREAALKKAQSKYPAVARERSNEQMIIITSYFIFGAFILGLFLFWAVVSIFYRLKLLIHAGVMSVTLLATLLPGREAGFNSMRQQFIKLIGLSVMTAFVMFFLSLSLVFGHKAYDVVYDSGAGWFTALIVEAIVVVVIFKYRNEIGQVFSKAAGHIPMPARPKSTVLDALQRNVTRTVYNSAASRVSSFFNRKEHEGVPSTFKPSALSTADTNINDATTASMMLRYQREKQAAEQLATENGGPVQYSPFVQKVNENLRVGTKNPFRGMDKEWKEEKTRLSAIKADGGDVRTAVLMQGVRDDMNDQEVAATLYSNENAIRDAGSFMVNRPKSAVNQLSRAKTLNRNRKLETAVDDFVMVQLFQRYKTEYKNAVDTSIETGEPVRHTDFVKGMDARFKEAGLNTTQKVNTTMLSRNGRIAVASHFHSMPEYGEQKERLLKANEAFRKVAIQGGGVQDVVEFKPHPLQNPASILKNMPPLPKAGDIPPAPLLAQMNAAGAISYTTRTPLLITATNVTDPKLVIKDVKISNPELKNKIESSRANLKNNLTSAELQDMRLVIDTNAKTEVVMNLKNKVSTEVTGGLDDMQASLEIMKKARGRLPQADVSAANKNIEQSVAKKAQSGRKQTRTLKQLD